MTKTTCLKATTKYSHLQTNPVKYLNSSEHEQVILQLQATAQPMTPTERDARIYTHRYRHK